MEEETLEEETMEQRMEQETMEQETETMISQRISKTNQYRYSRNGGSTLSASLKSTTTSTVISYKTNHIDLKQNPDIIKFVLDASLVFSSILAMEKSPTTVIDTKTSHTVAQLWAQAVMANEEIRIVLDVTTYMMACVLQKHLCFENGMSEEAREIFKVYLKDHFKPYKDSFRKELTRTPGLKDLQKVTKEINALSKRVDRCVDKCLDQVEAAVRYTVYSAASCLFAHSVINCILDLRLDIS